MDVRLVFTLLIIFVSPHSWGQVDPTSSLLLRSSGSSSTQGTTSYDSGRFVVQPSTTTAASSPTSTAEAPSVKPTTSTKVVPVPSASVASSTVAPTTPSTTSELNKNTDDSSATPEASKEDDYKLHSEDIRHNLVQLKLSPTLIYLDSSSPYWFRSFNAGGVGLAAAADVWFSTQAGFHVDYMTSFGMSINSDPVSSEETVIDYRASHVAVQWRSYYGLSRKAPSVTWSAGVSDQQVLVPKQEQNRVGIKSSSPVFSLHSRIPDGVRSSLLIGIDFFPGVTIVESPTALQLKSGEDHDAFALKLSIGKEFLLDRKNQIYWKLSHRYEKAIYTEAANTTDPITQVVPSDISVRAGVSLFEFGYIWGD